jgi:pyruvate dehydrogenase E2 component (dihydrolipoamide acetyltransferase)
MAYEMILPKVDMDQETGTIVEWKKNNGDEVKEGEIILVIETDKVAIDVEAPASGILQGITSKPGDTLPIATVIAYILKPGEEMPAATKSAPAASPPAKTLIPAAQPAPPAPAAEAPAQATPIAQKMAADLGVDLSSVTGSGAQGKITKEDVKAAAESGKITPLADGKVNAVPAARRAARERGIDLASVSGSGPKGRIQSPDVMVATQTTAPVHAVEVLQSDQTIPLAGMRRTIAERMTASYQNVPHITFNARVDMGEFNKARNVLNKHAENTGGQRISATALIAKIVAMTLVRHPWLNSSLQGDNIVLYKDINMGVAVALEEGLIVPVVHSAQLKGIAQIAAEVNDLAERARDGKLLPGDVKGGTFTISNLGPFGVESFNAIINAPQAGILAIGATHNEAIPLDNGEIVSRPVMNISLSADHRIVDGAVAAYFIADLKEALENPILATY